MSWILTLLFIGGVLYYLLTPSKTKNKDEWLDWMLDEIADREAARKEREKYRGYDPYPD